MKKQSLLTLLSISTISMSLFFTPVSVYANALNPCDVRPNPCVTPPSQCVTPQNPCVIPEDPPCVTPPSSGETDANKDPQKGTIDASIVLKGKNIKCGSKLDRLLALEYLNEDKTRPDFDDISISVTINGKTSELVEGAHVDLTKHDGETIAINYKYHDRVSKTLKLKVDCTEEEKPAIAFTDEVVEGTIHFDEADANFTNTIANFDALKYVNNIEELGGRENINIKIMSLTPAPPKEVDKIDVVESGYDYKIIYSLKDDPNITKELVVLIIPD